MRRKAERGQSMIEVAIAIPLLILIVAGILDLGRAYFTYIALSDAAAEGAAYAAIHPQDTAQIIERTVDSSGGLVVLEPDMVSVGYAGLSAGSPVTVAVRYDYDLLTPIISALVPDGTITMKATVAQSILSGGG